ncbi:beta-ketoacyl synthase [Oxalobacteraceae bacterium]|nr:beta-ketoacyl synthase [Oxalobacteraceae bacterium]
MAQPMAITGIGLAAPSGLDCDTFWAALNGPAAASGAWRRGDLSAYPVDNVLALPARLWDKLCAPDSAADDYAGMLARHCLRQALAQAKPPAAAPQPLRIGCTLASSTAGNEALEQQQRGAPAPVSSAARIDPAYLLDAAGLAWSAPASLLSTACSSGLMAPALAMDLLQAGEADMMLAGGLDTLLEYTVCGFNGLRLASPGACQPFAPERPGVLLSEGAVCFAIEPLAAARARGAEVLALVLGYGISCDAGHPTAPTPDGPCRAMRQALAASGLEAGQLGGIITHGTGSVTNDQVELAALRELFGAQPLPPLTSIKGALGHPQAAAGAFALLAAVLALRHGALPPIAGVAGADPALGQFDPVLGAARPLAAPYLMVDAFGFGGNNCAMIVASAALAATSQEHSHA